MEKERAKRIGTRIGVIIACYIFSGCRLCELRRLRERDFQREMFTRIRHGDQMVALSCSLCIETFEAEPGAIYSAH